ncbi:MAG: hypothetical protein HW389_567 [Bacteroidetes bacterium]|nr:hypothetical protein [Bacteroidota bacterium]
MNSLWHLVGILVVGSILSCGSSRLFEHEESSSLRSRAMGREKYGEGVEYKFNSTKTAVLCVKESKTTLLVPQRQIAFFVFDVKADSILFEDNLANGSVGWNDEFSIIVKIIPGIEESDERSPHRQPGYIFDLRSKKTRSLESVIVQ